MPRSDDTVTLEVGGEKFTGWQAVRIVRGIEVFPSHFILRLTERLPDQPKMFPIDPGTRCRVLIGSDVLITGFVDRYASQVTASGHEVTVVGRSATADLIDCGCGVIPDHESEATMSFHAANLLQLAKDLCAPFGISVTEPDGEGASIVDVLGEIGQFSIALNRSAYDSTWTPGNRKLLVVRRNPGNSGARGTTPRPAAAFR
jgi:prophage tail gpP-like protein